MRTFSRVGLWTLVLIALPLGSCGERGRGNKHIGQHCESADECRRGLCVSGVAGDAPVCTRSCASSDECPHGWACSGVTEGNVLICSRGAPTPFGVGARE